MLFLPILSAAYVPAHVGAKQDPPTGRPAADYRFRSPTGAHNIPFELTSNKPYLRVRINNSGPLWFILDTGSIATVVDSEQARALGIALTGGEQVTGAGEGSLQSSIGTGVALSLQGLELAKRDTEVLPINAAIRSAEGRRVDGLLGYDFLNRFVVEIDYVQRRISIFDPRRYHYGGKGQSIPLEIQRGNIFITATLLVGDRGRLTDKFLVDTAWRSALSLSAPFVRERQLRTTTRTIHATTGVGIGGPRKDAVGRIEALQIGRYTVSSPVASFSRDRRGVLSEDGFAGIIGGEILRRFKVTFDYPHQRMILEPNPHYGEPYEFDMSGLFLIAEGENFKSFKIYDVIERSPAAESGLRKDDVIESIDGRPASQFTLEQLRQVLKQGAGKGLLLGIARGRQRLRIRVSLRRLI